MPTVQFITILSIFKVFLVKVGLSPFYVLLLQQFKNDENAFCFLQKSLFVLEIFKFVFSLLFLFIQKNSFIRKQVLSNSSISCTAQYTIKFCQLIEYSIRNNFLKNDTQNAVEKLVSNLFIKRQNWT